MIRQRHAELAALVDEVAPAGWRADRRWRALLAAAAVCERWGRADTRYLASNGEPHADTFMGSPGPGPTELAGWIGWAIAAGHALVTALVAREGQFPAQPLKVRLVRRHGLCRAVPARAPRTIGFAIGGRLIVAALDPRGPASEVELAARLARAARGADATADGDGARGGDRARAAGEPVATVAIGDDALAVAHHGHRRGWTADGGPWLGVARAEGLTLLSTCHLAVDGFAHAHLAHDVASTIDRAAIRTLAAAAAAITGDAPPPDLCPIAADVAVPLGVAWRRLPGPTPTVARQAWTLGRLLATGAGGVRARGATVQIPVADGPPDDPTRFARRVRTALATVRFPDSQPEPLDRFAARVKTALADEAVGRGLLGRLSAALVGAPLPLGLKRRWLGRARQDDGRGGPGELLAGDGCVSLLRRLPPLVAASVPGRVIADGADEATAVLTVIDDGHAAIATIAGRGGAGTAAGAAALLAAWVEGLDEARAATIPA
jgi:hypothetical protein